LHDPRAHAPTPTARGGPRRKQVTLLFGGIIACAKDDIKKSLAGYEHIG